MSDLYLLILDFFIRREYTTQCSAFPSETIERIERFGGATFLYFQGNGFSEKRLFIHIDL